MRGKLLILLVVVLAIALYLPDSRALMGSWIQPLVTPGYRWMTNQELSQIESDFEFYLENRDYSPLRRGEFDRWLDSRYPQPRSRIDSWGERYTLRMSRSGFQVISAGPDREVGTDDDLVVEGARD
jgi:hypothetical protein